MYELYAENSGTTLRCRKPNPTQRTSCNKRVLVAAIFVLTIFAASPSKQSVSPNRANCSSRDHIPSCRRSAALSSYFRDTTLRGPRTIFERRICQRAIGYAVDGYVFHSHHS